MCCSRDDCLLLGIMRFRNKGGVGDGGKGVNYKVFPIWKSSFDRNLETVYGATIKTKQTHVFIEGCTWMHILLHFQVYSK